MYRRRRIAALVIALLGAAGVTIWLLRPFVSSTARNDEKPAATTADATHSGKAVAPAATADTAETSASRTPSAVPITPEEFAKAWQARALKTIRNKNARLLGEEVADLLALPPDKAWAALTQRARDGNQNAASAALALANECQILQDLKKSDLSKSELSSHEKLSPHEVARLHAIEASQVSQMLANANACKRIEGSAEFTQFATDRFMRPDDPGVQLNAVQDIRDDNEAIAVLRQLASADPHGEAALVLAIRLLESADLANQTEGRALLEARAGNNDHEAIALLAACLRNSCDALLHADASTILPWETRAAGLGEWSAISMLIQDFTTLPYPTTAENAVSAWAWSQYRLTLARDGCFEALIPSITRLVGALRETERLGGNLTPTQRVQGEALLRQLLAQWSAQAHTAQGCG